MPTAIQQVPLKTITGEDAKLAHYAGKVLLVVNVASKCGLTPQYEALEKLYADKRDEGLVVLGFPGERLRRPGAGNQRRDPGLLPLELRHRLPRVLKIAVTGPETHPLYQALIAAQPQATSASGTDFREALKGYGMTPNPEPGILWNFEKFVVGRDGEVAARFTPDTKPDDPAVLAAIDKALAA